MPAETETIPIPQLDIQPAGEIPTVPAGAVPEPAGGEPEQAPRKRRRRGKSAPEPQAAPGEPQASPEDLERCQLALASTFGVLGAILARRRGNHWALSDEEQQTLGAVWTAALAPYLPRIGKAVPWAAALAVTWTMVQPRVARDAELAGVEIPTEPAA